jgi:FHIPEP family
VRGDAIAGLLVLLINVIGGMVIGIMQQGLSFAEAGHAYTLLSVRRRPGHAGAGADRRSPPAFWSQTPAIELLSLFWPRKRAKTKNEAKTCGNICAVAMPSIRARVAHLSIACARPPLPAAMGHRRAQYRPRQ